MSLMSRSTSRRSGSRSGRVGNIVRGVGRVAGRAIGAAGRGGPRRHRRRGITATELRGFRKIARLLRSVGMVPRGTRRAHTRRTA